MPSPQSQDKRSVPETLHPYRPSEGLHEDPLGSLGQTGPMLNTTITKQAVLFSILIWSFVCGVSAIPSFVVAVREFPNSFIPMCLGVITFIAMYVCADLATRSFPLRNRPTVSRSIKITYGLRILMVVFYPVAFYLDVKCGILTGALMEFMPIATITPEYREQSEPPLFIYIWTLMQGIALNIVLFFIWLLVFAITWFFRNATDLRKV